MKSDKYLITYIDVVYFYDEPTGDGLKLHKYQAVGYLSKNKNKDLILEYIKSERSSKKIVEGLIIPKEAISKNVSNPVIAKMGIDVGQSISVEWVDVVHVVNDNRSTVSLMRTQGVVHMKTNKFLLIKDPVTTRLKPSPKKSHPEKLPKYYLIPDLLIKKVKLN